MQPAASVVEGAGRVSPQVREERSQRFAMCQLRGSITAVPVEAHGQMR